MVGPGVDVGTTVEGVGKQSFALTLVDGTYQFFCDAHPLRMKGSFTVGAVTTPPKTPPPTTPTPPPPPTALTLTVTNTGLALRTPGGALAKKVVAGRFAIKVVDRSTKQNAHLLGAGVNRKTGVAGVGTVTWRVTLKPGKLTYRSDGKPTLRGGSVTVTA